MQPLIGAEYSDYLIQKFNAARHSIDIVVYDWRFYPDRPQHPVSLFNQALLRAIRRGVKVRALINNRTFLPNLQELKIEAKTPKDRRTLHTKFIIVDHATATIGSHNLTSNAFSSNYECSVAFNHPATIARLEQFFNNLYN